MASNNYHSENGQRQEAEDAFDKFLVNNFSALQFSVVVFLFFNAAHWLIGKDFIFYLMGFVHNALRVDQESELFLNNDVVIWGRILKMRDALYHLLFILMSLYWCFFIEYKKFKRRQARVWGNNTRK